jgi:PAS domain S-box-containing protein
MNLHEAPVRKVWPGFHEGGEMAALVRAHDWSATPLGPIEAWPQSLKTAVDLMIGSRQPVYVAWGRELTSLYNDGYIPIVGAKHPTGLGKPFNELWSEIREEYRPLVEAVMAGEAQHFVDRPAALGGRDGVAVGYFTFSWTPLRDETGVIRGFICNGLETTERVEAGRAFRRMFEASPTPFLVLAPDAPQFTIIEVNNAYLAAVMRTREELLGCGVFDAMPDNPDDPGATGVTNLRASLERAITTKRPDAMPRQRYDIPHPSGGFEERWWDPVNSPLLGAGGEVEALIHHVVDVTGQHRAQERLRDSEAKLRAVIEEAPLAMALTGTSGEILFRNPRFDKLWGRPPHATTARTYSEVYEGYHLDGRPIASEDWPGARALLKGEVVENDFYEIVEANGRRITCWFGGAPIRDASGEIAGAVVVFRDVSEERRTEAMLRESEARFRLMADAVPQIVWITNRHGGMEFLNRQFVDYTGASSEAWSPTEMAARFIHEDDGAKVVAAFEAALGTGKPFEVEHRIRSAAGEDRWFLARAEPYRDPSTGEITRWFGASVDIHDRKLAEDSLLALNADLEREVAQRTRERGLIWQHSLDLLSVIDMETATFDAVNPAWTSALGWTTEEIQGRPYANFVHPDDGGASERAFEHVRDGSPLLHFENRYRTTDGDWRWLSWVAVPEGGKLYSVTRDVTAERKRQAELEAAEAARREADALYRTYFENTPEALFVIAVGTDGGFLVEELNPAHEAGIGLKLADVRGKRIEDILPPDISDGVLATYRRVVETGEVYQYREVFDFHGNPQHWDTSLVPMRDAEGRVVRLIGSSRDVTRQVIAEDALRQSQKMEAMGQLTGGVAHDFNNLLMPIIGALDMLQRKGLGSDREQRLIAGAAQSAERAKTLVQRLLAFARRQPLQAVPVDVAKLVTGMGDLVASTTGPQIKVVVSAPEDLPAALADPNQLEMALLNLAVNARDAMPGGGTLRISAFMERVGPGHRSGVHPGAYICLSVADTGSGMDEATLARAVEPFFSTKGVGKGTGLGLSMVHGLASQLGGALTIKTQPGLGTNVEFWLRQSPVAPALDERPPESTLPMDRVGTALLVDDEDLVRMSTAEMLIDLGYAVIEASSAEEAMRLVGRGEPFDLLVTDHLMPGMNGTDLARAIRSTRPTVPVLLVSGYAEREGIDPDLPRLTKPFRKDELAAGLAQLSSPD